MGVPIREEICVPYFRENFKKGPVGPNFAFPVERKPRGAALKQKIELRLSTILYPIILPHGYHLSSTFLSSGNLLIGLDFPGVDAYI